MTSISRQVVWGVKTGRMAFGAVILDGVLGLEVRWSSYYLWRDMALLIMWWEYVLYEGAIKLGNGASISIGDWANPHIEGVAAHILATFEDRGL